MNTKNKIGNLGETKIIKLIEELVSKKTGKELISDDSFYYDLRGESTDGNLVLNSDMLVSTTDVPPQMSFHQIGRKSVIMNVSDLIVKGVKPKGLIISLGLPEDLIQQDFIDLVSGIIDSSKRFNLNYIGGDINQTKELIISPTVFGFKNPSGVIYRKGLKEGDYLIANGTFGLTGVGFDILINRNGTIKKYPDYKRAIMSVLEPRVSEIEAHFLSELKFATSSIDSSDGLAKSLTDLMISNPSFGFEIDFNEQLIDSEAIKYSREYNSSLEKLVFSGGEEFIHLFTISSKNYSNALKAIQSNQGNIYKIGKVISEENIYYIQDGKKQELKSFGFEHFK